MNKNDVLSIKTSCPIATISSEPEASDKGDVLFCCGSFDESHNNKLYFSVLNGEARTLKAAVAVDHQLPPSKLMFNPVSNQCSKKLLLSTGNDIILWKYWYSNGVKSTHVDLSVMPELTFSAQSAIDSPIISASWNKEDISILATGTVNGKVSLWDLCMATEVAGTAEKTSCLLDCQIAIQKREVYDLAFKPRSKTDLFIAGRDGTLKFIDTRRPDSFQLCHKQSDDSSIVKLSFNEANVNQLAFCSDDACYVSLVDLRWSSQPYCLLQMDSTVNSIEWAHRQSQFCNHLVSGSADGVVSVWDATSPLTTGLNVYPVVNSRTNKPIWSFLWYPIHPKNFIGVTTDTGLQILQI